MFNRKIIDLLTKWKNNPHRKPLILRGARQVGKTTAVNLFSQEFDNYIYLNLELKKDRDIFTESLSIQELFQAILVLKNINFKNGTTLIFIDEIQYSPVAVKMLRYFYEQMPQLFIMLRVLCSRSCWNDTISVFLLVESSFYICTHFHSKNF